MEVQYRPEKLWFLLDSGSSRQLSWADSVWIARMLANNALHIAKMLADGVFHIDRMLASVL